VRVPQVQDKLKVREIYGWAAACASTRPMVGQHFVPLFLRREASVAIPPL